MRRIIPLPFSPDLTVSSPAQLGAVLRAARTQAALSLEDLALTLGVSEGTVKSAVHRLRQRYRQLLHDEIAQTVSEPGEVDDELRHLFVVLGRR